MSLKKEILFLYDSDGKLAAVQVSPGLWARIEPILALAAPGAAVDSGNKIMDEFEDFMQFWDFPYPYNPAVACPACGASAPDWRTDKNFSLRNANIGGLLVFHCNGCGATIRHKYFKDHMAVEHSGAKSSG